MRTKILLKFGLILFLVIAASVFGSKTVGALNLPVKAGLGEACNTSAPCDVGFFCSESKNKCVQCESDDKCTLTLGEVCMNDVCNLPGGNNAGDLCANDNNCKSGLKCGARGICEEAGGGGSNLPAGCVDVDGNNSINEQDCGAPENENCVLCGTGGTGGGLPVEGGSGTGGETGKTGGEWDWTGINLTIQDVADIINGLACWLTRIATAIMVIFLVLAGLRFMNARGEPAKYESAKKNFQHVLIGILVIMAVYVIIATVAHAVGRTDFSLIPLVC